MPNYRRVREGRTYFFTVVTHGRRRWLCAPHARSALRDAIGAVREKRPFVIDAWGLLPDHLHCIWTLPEGDSDYAARWRLIKSAVTKRLALENGALRCANASCDGLPRSASREKRRERTVWQRRFWEHRVADDRDYANHCDYVHYNPVRHGLAGTATDWPYSTFHRFVADGLYPPDWGQKELVFAPKIGNE